MSARHPGRGKDPTAGFVDFVNGEQGVPAGGEDLARLVFQGKFFRHTGAFSTICAAGSRDS